MLILFSCVLTTAVAGLVQLEREGGLARQIPDQEFDRFYNGVYDDKGESGERYQEFDDEYFDNLTSDIRNNDEPNNGPIEDVIQHSDFVDYTTFTAHQDPAEVFSRLLFYMSKLPLV